jgi:hypothetical protein
MATQHQTLSAAVNERLARLIETRPASPKRPPTGAVTEDWYSYYAGYADAFVREIVQSLPRDIGTIIDPWNGAGSTTSVATTLGLRSHGFDLNPAAVVIAKARLLRSDVRASIAPLTAEVIAAAERSKDSALPGDTLLSWFTDRTAATLRRIERQIYRHLVSSDDEQRVLDRGDLSTVSSFSALFYLGLFRTVRPLVTPFIGSNPTWVRTRIDEHDRVAASPGALTTQFRLAMESLAAAVERAEHTYAGPCPGSVLAASSGELPLPDDSAHAVLTSPPYCTRIDYVMATLPELAALGMRRTEVRELRDKMIGTPTMTDAPAGKDPNWGSAATAVLRAITRHRSRAAKTYYAPFYRQYLRGMWASLREVARVTQKDAPAILVAQDSYFKDVHIDTPALIAGMGRELGWSLLNQHAFPVPANRANMHPGRSYRASSRATEQVLIFAT